MQEQYKWYKIDKKDSKTTLLDIKNNIINVPIIDVTPTDILVGYEYGGKNDYKSILLKMNNFKASQKIVTTCVFYSLLSNVLKVKNVTISDIKLLDCFDENDDLMNKYINQVNSQLSSQALNSLLEELSWLNSEGVDIKYISFDIYIEGLIYSFQIYSNGVIMIDDHNLLEVISKFIQLM